MAPHSTRWDDANGLPHLLRRSRMEGSIRYQLGWVGRTVVADTPIRQTDRGFGFMFAGFFAVLFGAVWAVFDVRWDWAAILSVGFLVAALIVPWVLLPLNRLWGRFALRIGQINNHLVLGIFFFAVMLPTGLIIRLFGNDPMARRSRRRVDSYWQPVRRSPDRENFSDMF